MIEQVNGFITPMKGWDAVEKNDKKITGTENGTKSVFQSVLEDTVQNQCHLVKLIGSLRGKPLTKIYKL
ncbi:MAG: hypothetical protein ACLUAR_05635 [Pilosibacter sp.]